VPWRERAVHVPALARALERCRERLEHRFVELDVDAWRAPLLQRDRDFDPPARDAFLDERPNPRFDAAERRRRTQLQIEKTVVDRLDRHADRRGVVLAGQRGKTGHALGHVACRYPLDAGRYSLWTARATFTQWAAARSPDDRRSAASRASRTHRRAGSADRHAGRFPPPVRARA